MAWLQQLFPVCPSSARNGSLSILTVSEKHSSSLALSRRVRPSCYLCAEFHANESLQLCESSKGTTAKTRRGDVHAASAAGKTEHRRHPDGQPRLGRAWCVR